MTCPFQHLGLQLVGISIQVWQSDSKAWCHSLVPPSRGMNPQRCSPTFQEDFQWGLKQLLVYAQRSWINLNWSWKFNEKNPVFKPTWLMRVSLFYLCPWFHLTSNSQNNSSADKQELSACLCWRPHSHWIKVTRGPQRDATSYWPQMWGYAHRTILWPPNVLFHLQVI